MSFTGIKTSIGIACVALAATSAVAKTTLSHVTLTVKPGESLSSLFRQLHLTPQTLQAVNSPAAAKSHFSHMQPGQKITFSIDAHHQLQQIIFYDKHSTLYVTASGKHFTATVKNNVATKATSHKKSMHTTKPLALAPVHMKMALNYRSVEIKGPLKNSALQAGVSSSLYAQLTKIFAPQINLDAQAHRGDHFKIAYEEYYINGKKDHAGDIVAAQYITHNKTYKAVRFSYPGVQTAYYTPDGTSIAPAFLSAPLHYNRITSMFTYARMDPYIHEKRPHLGVDYSAPEGTPIYSIGNGRVEVSGPSHGYGNMVTIDYGTHYKALYGHLERIALGAHTGDYVTRGQVIGYLGHTGWATGPNLHFGLFVDGTPRDPLTVRLPRADTIPSAYSSHYLAFARDMMQQLNISDAPEFAENDTPKYKYRT